MQLSVPAAGSYQKWRNVSKRVVLASQVTSLEAFKTVCLDKDVLYTALVTMHTVCGDEVEKPISNR